MVLTVTRRATAPRASLRDRLADKTREVIIDAVIDQLGDTGVLEFSYFEIARRAGLSVRTVYRHFPEREALFDAVGVRINARVGFSEYPRTPEAMVRLTRDLYPAFDRNAPLIIAQQQTRLGAQVRGHARRDRHAAIQEVVAVCAPHLPAERRHQAAALLACLMSGDAWRRMRDDFGLSGEQSGAVAAWAIDNLCKALAAENRDTTWSTSSGTSRRREAGSSSPRTSRIR
jgi:AcrR family transcriptional regulator